MAVVLAAALFPGTALGAIVTFPTDQNILLSGNNVTVKVAANSQANSLTVGATTITVTIAGGESFQLKDTDTSRLLRFTVDGVYNTICADSQSYVLLQPTETTTYVIEPQPSVLCASAGGGGGG